MKFSKPSSAVCLLATIGSSCAFAPLVKTTGSPHRTSSAVASTPSPVREEWTGYYMDYDDSQVILTDADVGFDPFEFSKTNAGLFFMREAEIKHCRLAMLAAAHWPVAELLDRPLANLIGQPALVDAVDRSPSILNGGLDKINPWYWATILVVASFIDLYQINKANFDPNYTSGNLGFDPLGLYPKDKEGQKTMLAKELRNGRLAMIAISAFAAQEWVSNAGILDQPALLLGGSV